MLKLWSTWKNIMLKVGDFQASVIFSVLYFFLLAPLGIVSSLFVDFLGLRRKPTWLEVKDGYSTIKKLKEQ